MSNPEKPPIDTVTLIPDQPLTKQEEQQCIYYLDNYEPTIIWEVGQKVTAYIDTKIVNLYIRSIDPRTLFYGTLSDEGEITIAPHQQIGEPPTQEERESDAPQFTKSMTRPSEEPLLTINTVPPGTEIQIKIKTTKK